MGDLSLNFSRHEFACNDGCGFDTVDFELIKICEFIRKINGNVSITPSSGCRCAHRNYLSHGASDKSQHLKGRAADLHVSDPRKVYDALCAKWPNKYGFGLYKDRVHVDSRSGIAARWTI